MFSALSHLGQFHTAISLVSIGAGLVAFVRDGRINPRNWTGKLYLGTMLVASLTALGIFRHGTFTLGHALSLVTLALLFLGLGAHRFGWSQHKADLVQVLSYSASYLLLMVFATTETLTRLPAGQPIAAGPQSPMLAAVHATLLLGYLVGAYFQVRQAKLAVAH